MIALIQWFRIQRQNEWYWLHQEASEVALPFHFHNTVSYQQQPKVPVVPENKTKTPIVHEEVDTEPVAEIPSSFADDFNEDDYEEIQVEENPVVLSRQGWISLNNEEIAKSVDLFAMALRADPQNIEALYGMGYALERSSEILAGYQRGVEHIEKKDQAIDHYCRLLGVENVPPAIRSQVGGRLAMLNGDCVL